MTAVLYNTAALSADELEKSLRSNAQYAAELETAKGTFLYAFLTQRAEASARQAMAALVEIDPADAAALTRAQNEVKRHRDMVTWIDTQIQIGHDAIRELRSREGAASQLGETPGG